MRKILLISALYFLGVQGLHCEDFHGRNCVDGCPEMKDGYKWAQDNDARDPYLCIGRSRDFEQGCGAYVIEAGPKIPPPKKTDDSHPYDAPTNGDQDLNDDDRNAQPDSTQPGETQPDEAKPDE